MDSQRPNIAFSVVVTTIQLRRSAQFIANIVGQLASTLAQSGEPKISQLEAILLEQNVLRFNIPMDYTQAVEQG